MEDGEVVSEAVWHALQPMASKSERPLLIAVVPPGTVADGVGGAVMRMNMANFTTSLEVPRLFALKWVRSSGVGLILQFAGRPEALPSPGIGASGAKASLLTHCSTLQ